MKIISEQLIRSLEISPAQCVEWIKESFSLKKDAQLPAKISVHPKDKDFFTSMPCLLPEMGDSRYFGVKEVHRLEGAVPSLGSDLLLYDAKSGALLAIMDGDWITTMRTGAVAALSAKSLRRQTTSQPPAPPIRGIEPTAVGPTTLIACATPLAGMESSLDRAIYGMLGLGNTARATLLCAIAAEPEKHFTVKLLRYKDQAEQFAARFRSFANVDFEIVDSMREMLAGELDVLISCVTCADGLLVEDESLFKPGITVIPVHTRGFQNCDRVFDRVFGDDTDHVRGFKYFSEFRDYAEIGEVFAGRDPGRRSPEERILDYNVGLGLHDVVFASKIYEMLDGREDIPEAAWEKETEKFWI